MSEKLLPSVKNSEQYNLLFKNDQIWLSAIHHIVEKHKLKGTITRGVKGSHIVYRVGNVWIKLMAPIYAKDFVFEIAGLESVYGQLEVATPKIIHSDRLEDWPYVVMTHVDGLRIGDIFFDLDLDQQVQLATKLGAVTKQLRAVEFDARLLSRGKWDEFISHQFDSVFKNHEMKKMNASWLPGLVEFMQAFKISQFTMDRPVFLHSDLTWDHFLVSKVNGQWQVNGLIDFADCQVGHPEYELAATSAFLLKGRQKALSCYLEATGLFDQINHQVSEKLLAWTLLHLYSDLKNYFVKEMDQVKNGDFRSLARLVYPL